MDRPTQTGSNYAFDSAGNLTVGYGYDAASNRTSMTDPQNLPTTLGGRKYAAEFLLRSPRLKL